MLVGVPLYRICGHYSGAKPGIPSEEERLEILLRFPNDPWNDICVTGFPASDLRSLRGLHSLELLLEIHALSLRNGDRAFGTDHGPLLGGALPLNPK